MLQKVGNDIDICLRAIDKTHRSLSLSLFVTRLVVAYLLFVNYPRLQISIEVVSSYMYTKHTYTVQSLYIRSHQTHNDLLSTKRVFGLILCADDFIRN